MPLQRVRLFFADGEFVVLVGLFLIPVFLFYELLRQLWQNVRPVPFKRDEILRLLTSHFGIEGATEYVDGLRYGFIERPSLKHCGHGRSLSSVGIRHSRESRAYIAGREDGAWLRRAPDRLRQILDRRCSAPMHLKADRSALLRCAKGAALGATKPRT
jgi:hypothetical protein